MVHKLVMVATVLYYVVVVYCESYGEDGERLPTVVAPKYLISPVVCAVLAADVGDAGAVGGRQHEHYFALAGELYAGDACAVLLLVGDDQPRLHIPLELQQHDIYVAVVAVVVSVAVFVVVVAVVAVAVIVAAVVELVAAAAVYKVQLEASDVNYYNVYYLHLRLVVVAEIVVAAVSVAAVAGLVIVAAEVWSMLELIVFEAEHCSEVSSSPDQLVQVFAVLLSRSPSVGADLDCY